MNLSLYTQTHFQDQGTPQEPLIPERSPSFQLQIPCTESLDLNDVSLQCVEGHPLNLDYMAQLLCPVFCLNKYPSTKLYWNCYHTFRMFYPGTMVPKSLPNYHMELR